MSWFNLFYGIIKITNFYLSGKAYHNRNLKYFRHVLSLYYMFHAVNCGFMATESRCFSIKCNSFVLISLILVCDEIFVFNREKQIEITWVRLLLLVIFFRTFSVKFYGIDRKSRNHLLVIHILCAHLYSDLI